MLSVPCRWWYIKKGCCISCAHIMMMTTLLIDPLEETSTCRQEEPGIKPLVHRCSTNRATFPKQTVYAGSSIVLLPVCVQSPPLLPSLLHSVFIDLFSLTTGKKSGLNQSLCLPLQISFFTRLPRHHLKTLLLLAVINQNTFSIRLDPSLLLAVSNVFMTL